MSEAGREMDAAICAAVFGCKIGWVCDGPAPEPYCDCWPLTHGNGSMANLRDYSTSIADAWRLVERMRELGYWLKLTGPWTAEDADYSAGFTPFGTVHCGSSWVQATGDTAQLAINRAALVCIEASARKSEDAQ